MIQIYYGDGKGKTSALNGSAIRASGDSKRVGVFRFLKGMETSEDKALMQLGIYVEKINVGTKFVFEMNDYEKLELKKLVLDRMAFIIKNKNNYDVLVLDEFLDLAASNVSIVSAEEMNEFIDYVKDKELIISGHTKVKLLFKRADLITKLKKERHYFDLGIKARKGFEF